MSQLQCTLATVSPTSWTNDLGLQSKQLSRNTTRVNVIVVREVSFGKAPSMKPHVESNAGASPWEVNQDYYTCKSFSMKNNKLGQSNVKLTM